MPHEVATPIAGDPLDAASASVLAAAAELGAMVHRLVEREGGVTLLQYRVLGVLAAARAPVEPRELARLLGVGSGHLTAVLDGLERGGLLTRERHSSDARR
jgi:DNA-binding MarR family transcriptional regulator